MYPSSQRSVDARVLKIGRDLWLDGYHRVEHAEDEAICETNDYIRSPSSRMRQGVTRDVVGASNECPKWLESSVVQLLTREEEDVARVDVEPVAGGAEHGNPYATLPGSVNCQ